MSTFGCEATAGASRARRARRDPRQPRAIDLDGASGRNAKREAPDRFAGYVLEDGSEQAFWEHVFI